MKTSAKAHLMLSLIFFGIALFEVLVFTDILHTPYMVGLLIFLCGVGGFQFGIGLAKFFRSL